MRLINCENFTCAIGSLFTMHTQEKDLIQLQHIHLKHKHALKQRFWTIASKSCKLSFHKCIYAYLSKDKVTDHSLAGKEPFFCLTSSVISYFIAFLLAHHLTQIILMPVNVWKCLLAMKFFFLEIIFWVHCEI